MSTVKTAVCPKCSNPLEAGAKFCPACGSAVSGIFSGGGSPLDGTAIVMAEDADTLFPILQEATLGDYDIYGELGRGGMAAVYLALDLALNRKVAIKTMLPELLSREGMVQRFKREAQTAAALSHPHIIQIFSVKETPRLVYFVMKYIEGRALESVMMEQGALSVPLTRAILAQAGGALAFAHRKGVFHRDVKPANIMLEEDGWAIVTDFGIAKVSDATNLTGTGTAIGTPHYMSPEQFHNKNISGASDQYSLGVVAYEMLSGRKPYDGGTYAEILTQHLFEPPPDIRQVRPDVPANVAEAIMRMMAKDPAQRFPNVDEAIEAFGEISQAEQQAVRKQMMELAKSGAPRKVRMSVPVSPIPQGRRPGAGRTAVERTGMTPTQAVRTQQATRQHAAPTPKPKSKVGMILGIAASVIVIAGGSAYAVLRFQNSQQSVKPTAPTPAVQDSQPSTPAVTIPKTDTIVKHDTVVVPQGDAKPPVVANKPSSKKPKPPADSKPADTHKNPPANVEKPAHKDSTPAVTGGKAEPAKPEPAKPETPAAPATAQVKLARLGEQASILYINGHVVGPLGTPILYEIPAGKPVNITVKVNGCAATWDTTVTLNAGEQKTIGKRGPSC